MKSERILNIIMKNFQVCLSVYNFSYIWDEIYFTSICRVCSTAATFPQRFRRCISPSFVGYVQPL
jgi:hypothetical protein